MGWRGGERAVRERSRTTTRLWGRSRRVREACAAAALTATQTHTQISSRTQSLCLLIIILRNNHPLLCDSPPFSRLYLHILISFSFSRVELFEIATGKEENDDAAERQPLLVNTNKHLSHCCERSDVTGTQQCSCVLLLPASRIGGILLPFRAETGGDWEEKIIFANGEFESRVISSSLQRAHPLISRSPISLLIRITTRRLANTFNPPAHCLTPSSPSCR